MVFDLSIDENESKTYMPPPGRCVRFGPEPRWQCDLGHSITKFIPTHSIFLWQTRRIIRRRYHGASAILQGIYGLTLRSGRPGFLLCLRRVTPGRLIRGRHGLGGASLCLSAQNRYLANGDFPLLFLSIFVFIYIKKFVPWQGNTQNFTPDVIRKRGGFQFIQRRRVLGASSTCTRDQDVVFRNTFGSHGLLLY